jgi:signal transduction histidine kinase
VRLYEDDGYIVLSVEDDGQGFDPRIALYGGEQEGIGLSGLRERMETLGGELRIDSNPEEGGARLVALVPWT